ncbi:hypothetical protein PGC08_13155 [Brevibacterium sp. BDJS002]|uniref:hypothetical protein n=1 Tax=Brevibacterium sp. BDJS002 TaxID=3020906 RepID=UPI002308116C|nr:hypothetical protein [Brevibacterium sp. BDJS002]WCE38951.1 hypothetical protein PGC08_13155 [Brevibacterium sp. BDJS002]
MTTRSDDRTGGGLLLGAGAVLLMALCCALPLLIAGGVLAGLGGFLGNPWVLGTGIALVTLVVLAVARRRTRSDRSIHDCCPPMDPDHPTDTKDEQTP